VLAAIECGAVGFIPKSAKRSVIASALQLVFAGGRYLPPEMLSSEPSTDTRFVEERGVENGPSPSELGLTERQVTVLGLVMEGLDNKTISRELNVTEASVKNRVTAIMKAMKVKNRTEAVVAADRLGWKLRRAQEAAGLLRAVLPKEKT
jgi:DNA-binding NarL/FixJ family response regulator